MAFDIGPVPVYRVGHYVSTTEEQTMPSRIDRIYSTKERLEEPLLTGTSDQGRYFSDGFESYLIGGMIHKLSEEEFSAALDTAAELHRKSVARYVDRHALNVEDG